MAARVTGETKGPMNGPTRECLRLLGPQPPYLVEQLARSRRVGIEEDESFGIDQGAVPLAPLHVEDGDGLEDAGIVPAQLMGLEHRRLGFNEAADLLQG